MLRGGHNQAAAALAASAGIQVGAVGGGATRPTAACGSHEPGTLPSAAEPLRPPSGTPPRLNLHTPRLIPHTTPQPLVELHIFAGAQRVVEALRGHDCGPALAWCEEQRPRLRKARSKLEFKLRVQVSAGWGWG